MPFGLTPDASGSDRVSLIENHPVHELREPILDFVASKLLLHLFRGLYTSLQVVAVYGFARS